MSYRPPSKAPLTDWGRFIVRRRSELDWSATQAFEAVQPRLGLARKSRTAYLPFEFDREPTAEQAAVFREVFGGEPGEQDRAQEPKAAEAVGIGDLVTAINALVNEMRLARERDQDAAAAMVRAAEVLLSAQRTAGVAASTERDVPLGTER